MTGDTHPEAARRFQAMIMSRTGEERLKMGCSMFAAARRLALANIRAQNPWLSRRVTPGTFPAVLSA